MFAWPPNAELRAVAAVGGLAAFALAAWWPGASGLLSGAQFATAAPERLLALAGLGLAAASGPAASAGLALVGFALGALLAAGAKSTPLWPLLMEADTFRRLHLLGPAACALSGLVLVLPQRLRSAAVPVAALLVAVALMLTTLFNDPDPTIGLFSAGATLSFLWLAACVAIIARNLRRPWFAIPERIAGSWCLAIGLLLGGLQFAPPKVPPAVAAMPSPQPFVPGLDPMPIPQRPFAPLPGPIGREQAY